jgi:hypothetical protein
VAISASSVVHSSDAALRGRGASSCDTEASSSAGHDQFAPEVNAAADILKDDSIDYRILNIRGVVAIHTKRKRACRSSTVDLESVRRVVSYSLLISLIRIQDRD